MKKRQAFITECDYENIKRIVKNDKAVGKRNNGLRITLYSIFICFVNKYRKADYSELFVVNGKEEVGRIDHADATTLCYALVSNNLRDYRKMLTHVSYISFFRRLRLIFYAIIYHYKGVPFGYFLDYILWRDFFSVYRAEKIGGFGHYDRLTTQIALLSDQFEKSYYMKQHGLIGNNMNLPYKIPVSKIVAFNDKEVQKFKKEIVLNIDCDYQIEYVSFVEFDYTEKSGKRIGIIDTPIDEMPELINIVKKHSTNADYIVMCHPLSRIKEDEFEKYGFKFVCDKKKELNYDAIFAGPSTLVYDYVRAGFINPIVVYVMEDSSGLCEVANTYKNVIICHSLDDFNKRCEQITCSIN